MRWAQDPDQDQNQNKQYNSRCLNWNRTRNKQDLLPTNDNSNLIDERPTRTGNYVECK